MRHWHFPFFFFFWPNESYKQLYETMNDNDAYYGATRSEGRRLTVYKDRQEMGTRGTGRVIWRISSVFIDDAFTGLLEGESFTKSGGVYFA